jgi:Ser/Thr protein kinase RdoA (MazF antagonist)
VKGSIADDCRDAHTPAFMRELGVFLGKMVRALESFEHPGAERWHQWDNANALTVRQFMAAVEDTSCRAIAEAVLDDFEAKVTPVASQLRRGSTHNDANEQNVIVHLETSGECAGPFAARVVGIIDFGDINVSWRVNDVAITCAYYMLNKRDPIGDAASCLAGFESSYPLTDVERSIVPTLMAARLVVSCVLGAYSAAQDPANKEYLLTTQKPGWEVLRALRDAGDEEILSRFASARAA